MATSIGMKKQGFGGNPADHIDNNDLTAVAGLSIGQALQAVAPQAVLEDTYDNTPDLGMDNTPTPSPRLG
jgi:hypothetical protein